MRILTEDAVLKCDHGGVVGIAPRQDWVKVATRRILIEPDPLDRPVAACPMFTPTTPPCAHTVSVSEVPSYAGYVRIRSRDEAALRVCLATATGHTDWAKVNTVSWSVAVAGQALVDIR